MIGLDTLVALLAAVGLLALIWVLFGRLLTPVGKAMPEDLFTLVRGAGDGETLEQNVEALLWLADSQLARTQVRIVDCGLSQTGLELALRLCARYPELQVIDLEELTGLVSGEPR